MDEGGGIWCCFSFRWGPKASAAARSTPRPLPRQELGPSLTRGTLSTSLLDTEPKDFEILPAIYLQRRSFPLHASRSGPRCRSSHGQLSLASRHMSRALNSANLMRTDDVMRPSLYPFSRIGMKICTITAPSPFAYSSPASSGTAPPSPPRRPCRCPRP
jgi:hypothetical protein